jgi:C4-dicarboxylate-specific signal transduction histidine kinase
MIGGFPLIHRLTFLIPALVCGPLSAGPQTAPPKGPLRVLLVHSFGRDFAPFSEVSKGFRSELSLISPRPVEFLEVSLEMTMPDEKGKTDPLVAYLQAACGKYRPDLVVPFGAPAVGFCITHRDHLFPNTPLLATGADKRRMAGWGNPPWLSSVHFELNLPAIARDMHRLLPDLRHLAVVLGTSPVEQFWESELRKEWPPLLPGVEIHWMSDKPLADIEREIARLPPDSAVFHGIMARDAGGSPHEYENALARVATASNAPVFGYSLEQLGAGIVGGPLVSMRECGKRAAAVALRLLNGETTANIRTPAVHPEPPTYDWRELRRWNIPQSRIPRTASIVHKPPGLWQSHRGTVLAAGAALLVEAFLITMLATARKRARESTHGLNLATEAAQAGLWSHDTQDPDLIEASPEWRALFDLPAKGPIRKEMVLARIHPEDRILVSRAWERAATAESDYELEHRIMRQTGEIRWISSRGKTAQHPKNGSRTRGLSMDITRRKQTETELETKRRELHHLGRVTSLGEMSGALAHELNQPLGAILSNAEAAIRLTSKPQANPAEIREILGDIVNQNRRAADVIQRLRNLLEHGKHTPQATDVREMTETVLSLLTTELRQRGISIRREFAEDSPPAHADPVQLQQVLLNLLNNACDATESLPRGERSITIATTHASGKITTEIRDNGSGFTSPPETCMLPFHTTKERGLGMGLAICRSIITAHGGSLSARSLPAGGACVSFTLPTTTTP